MKTRLASLTLGLLLAASTAFAAPRPVITVDGAAAAARLQPATRDAIAPKIVALNAQLEKVRDNTLTDTEVQAIHQSCLALHDAIAAQLDAGQRTAFVAYLHAQMDAAGIDYKKFHGQHHEHHE